MIDDEDHSEWARFTKKVVRLKESKVRHLTQSKNRNLPQKKTNQSPKYQNLTFLKLV